jgi:hypothetical protein
VLITGIFGFSGIILTNMLSAKTAREQAEESDRKNRQLQNDIAKALDQRIDLFAAAFDRYHQETVKAIVAGRDKDPS